MDSSGIQQNNSPTFSIQTFKPTVCMDTGGLEIKKKIELTVIIWCKSADSDFSLQLEPKPYNISSTATAESLLLISINRNSV